MNPNTWYIIVNPKAGNGLAARQWLPTVELLDKAQLDYEPIFSEYKGHCTELAKAAIENGYRKIVAYGGDGTANEVINGIMQQTVVPSNEITFALFPAGTGNDWIKEHGIKPRVEEGVLNLMDGNTRLQDIGLATYHKNGAQQQHYFMNVAGMAYDGYVGKVLHEQKSPVTNQLVYLYLIFKCLMGYEPARAKVFFNGKEQEENFYLVNAGICRYSAGGMQFVPHAVPDDGLLALTIAGNISKWDIFTYLRKFYNGTLNDHPKVEMYQTKHARIEAVGSEPVLLEVDGEFLGETPVEFSVLEGALQFIIPSESPG